MNFKVGDWVTCVVESKYSDCDARCPFGETRQIEYITLKGGWYLLHVILVVGCS